MTDIEREIILELNKKTHNDLLIVFRDIQSIARHPWVKVRLPVSGVIGSNDC